LLLWLLGYVAHTEANRWLVITLRDPLSAAGDYLLRKSSEMEVEALAGELLANPCNRPEVSLLMIAPNQRNKAQRLIKTHADLDDPDILNQLTYVHYNSFEM
jgi:hypothetical protein